MKLLSYGIRIYAYLFVCALWCFTANAQNGQAVTQPSTAQPSTPKIRVLILSGSGDYAHPWLPTAIYMQQFLVDTGRFDAKIEEQVPGITATTLSQFDVLLDDYQGPRWGEQTEQAVADFLRSGKGMFAMHDALFGPLFGEAIERGNFHMTGDAWDQYTIMLGEFWDLKKLNHAPRHEFVVQWADKDHPISKGLAATFSTNDELYHNIDLKPNVHVLATAFDDPTFRGGLGTMQPVAWSVPYGQGRVVVTTLGHDLLAMSSPGFTSLLSRGLEWAATGEIATTTAEANPRGQAGQSAALKPGQSTQDTRDPTTPVK
jgi:type 1 glutamine amidotransferase